jgi:uncharacterized protein (DUF427 family)
MEHRIMKAVLKDHVIATSNDLVELDGYQYFPSSCVQLQWLEKAPKTASDLECPHGVQFYDVVIGSERHARAAWVYEAPKPVMQHVAHRVGFWGEVKVG